MLLMRLRWIAIRICLRTQKSWPKVLICVALSTYTIHDETQTLKVS